MVLTRHLPWAQQWWSGKGLRVQEAPSTAAVHMPGVRGDALCHIYPWAADFRKPAAACRAAQCHENLTFCCRCSMLEIYNEVITDLLNPSASNLQIREDIKRGCYVEDLSEHTVQNGEIGVL